MEQVNTDNTPSSTLIPRIQALLRLASNLIKLLDDMIQESNFRADLAPHRQWLEDAKTNIERYREGLREGSLEGDALKVSLWSGQLFSSYKYISDVAIPSRSQDRMIALAVEINRVARSIYGDIKKFDPSTVKAMNEALQGFKE